MNAFHCAFTWNIDNQLLVTSDEFGFWSTKEFVMIGGTIWKVISNKEIPQIKSVNCSLPKLAIGDTPGITMVSKLGKLCAVVFRFKQISFLTLNDAGFLVS